MFESSISGELPPPPPRDFFGRDELIEKIIDLAKSLTPIALIGAGGIGKTSIALTALHDDRIKQRFGDYRRFIRCDKFPPLAAHFLRRLSEVIGAGIENLEDLTPLRPFLSSKEMIIILDNAESILDPQGAGSQEIYSMVEELSQSRNICLCITSRISIIPPNCEVFNVRTLSVEAGRDAFYQIYKIGERTDLINDILEQLDFHPLSVTLLATVAQRNTWNARRLTEEWRRQRTGMLHAHHNKSLAATIKLSLASPTFQELGPDARGLLGVIAFFPQGINEDNFEWLFPTISDGINILDTFCTLSLTYRSDGYVTMLAPLRDHLCPKDPISSPLLCMAKESYFTRLSVDLHPQKPGFVKAQWITSEDGNVEHLLDVFTTIDANSDDVWDACVSFMQHLLWYKGRLVALRPSIEGLPDNHRSKPECLSALSGLFISAGNHTESKQLFAHAMDLWRERGDDHQVAQILLYLSFVNTVTGFYEEAMRQAEEALQISKQLGGAVEQAESLGSLAWALHRDGQLDAAEEAVSRAIDLLPEEGEELLTSRYHRILGEIYHSKGNTSKAASHLEVALEIASPLNWSEELFWVHSSLAILYLTQGRVDDAHTHIEHVKSYPVANVYRLGFTVFLEARCLYLQRRLEEAKLEALRAVDMFEKFELPVWLGDSRGLLRDIEEAIDSAVTPGSDDSGEPPEIIAHAALVDSSCSDRATESE